MNKILPVDDKREQNERDTEIVSVAPCLIFEGKTLSFLVAARTKVNPKIDNSRYKMSCHEKLYSQIIIIMKIIVIIIVLSRARRCNKKRTAIQCSIIYHCISFTINSYSTPIIFIIQDTTL